MVWRNHGISRIDISRQLNLYRSTVSNIIGTLLNNDVLLEGEWESDVVRSGRKPVNLKINDAFGCIIGIELQIDVFSVVASTFSGDILFSTSGVTPCAPFPDADPAQLFVFNIDKIIEQILPRIAELSVPPLGIGIGIPGIIDVNKGIIIRSDPFSITGYNYAETLRTRYGIPLVIENDANCCAWLQCQNYRKNQNRDFLSVLTRNYKNNGPRYREYYKYGIGVGLAATMSGRVLYGHNYAFGEYISHSWKPNKTGQNGLPEAVINTVQTNDDSYAEFICDLFSTLTTFIPLLGPNAVFLHGQPAARHQLIHTVIAAQVPQFLKVLDNCNASFTVMPEMPYEIAHGAAAMFLQRLFSIDETDGTDSYSHVSWDEIFAVRQKNKTGPQFHTGLVRA
jgi:Transcriptional regulator/sugar kinase